MHTNTEPCSPARTIAGLRFDWCLDEIQALFSLPFNDLLFLAQSVHREHFQQI